jgi:hypothetical protein
MGFTGFGLQSKSKGSVPNCKAVTLKFPAAIVADMATKKAAKVIHGPATVTLAVLFGALGDIQDSPRVSNLGVGRQIRGDRFKPRIVALDVELSAVFVRLLHKISTVDAKVQRPVVWRQQSFSNFFLEPG